MTFDKYIQKIEEDLRRGHATEHTYRSSLEYLVESYKPGIDASNDPKHVACGAPDFLVEKGKVPLGYIETKIIGEDLDKVEKTDQMKRYLKALNNLILTDYLEFRWYVNGERKLILRLAELGKNDRLVVNSNAETACRQMFTDFFATEAPTVGSPKELAIRLAGVTHFIRDQIASALESGDPDLQKALEQQYKTFVDLLLPALTHTEFADLYAQAITYGLFAAKMSAPEGVSFSLEDAYKYLRGNPFLRRLFLDVNEQLDEIDIIKPYLKDIVSLLNRADFDTIHRDFGRRTHTEDPVMHFYETFLATYDPKLRESRGVYYTPEPVVQFIVRAVDDLLKTRFGKPWGLADDSVKVLDPATGTGTFLYYVIQQIHNELVNQRGQAGQWQEKSKSMLKRLFGFELLIAPYVVSHLKLGLLMDSLGAPIAGKDERINVFLTNTLEEGVERAEMLAGLGLNIAQESSEASKVKKANDIMVVLGNPPYSNFGSMNRGEWILDLLDDYKKGLNEKKINLDDDFIKFIRYGQWRIDKTGQGILAFITNNTFIDGITHRRMRESLLKSFDEIFILDLHGSTRKKEVNPKGGKDENVFDIQQGVSIFIAVKFPILGRRTKAPINYASIWGTRSEKYQFLSDSQIEKISWVNITPNPPRYFFSPNENNYLTEYEKYIPITSIFQKSSSGFQTKRDKITISFSKDELIKILNDLTSLNDDAFRLKYSLPPDGRDWKIEWARRHAAILKKDDRLLSEVQYRPFDKRWSIVDDKSKGIVAYPRFEIMRNFLKINLGMVCTRQISLASFQHVFVSTLPIDGNTISLQTREYNYIFPLYVYSDQKHKNLSLFDSQENARDCNFSPQFIEKIHGNLKIDLDPKDPNKHFDPENIFYYMYAIFHCPTYRTRYAEFLKIDFPRLPLTSDKKLFIKLVAKGKELVELHLLKTPKVDEFITTYPVSGDNKVEKVTFAPSHSGGGSGRGGDVHINPRQYFGGVPEEVWNFKIGGYQVCDKWLKDRKGRVLSGEDITHYQRVVVALKETIRLMKEIDKTIPKWPIE